MFGFKCVEAAPEVDKPFSETNTTAVKSPTEQKVDETKSTIEQKVDETKSTIEQKVDETKSPTEQKVDETKSTIEQKADETKSPTPKPKAAIPEPYISNVESNILNYLKQYDGKTIVDIEFEGAGADTLPTVKMAVTENVGDTFDAAAALRDRNALINTGYFYEVYQTFEVIPEGVVMTFHVMENGILKDVAFSGNTLYTNDELQELVKSKRGEILNNNSVHDDIAAIQEDYHKEGFILMKVTDINFDDTGTLHLKINEGTLEGYSVKGNRKTKDKVILREMRQEVGTPFNAKLARRSMQRVYNLGFFEDVNIKMNPGVEPNAIVMEVNVKEKRTGTFGIGAGYSTADGIIGMVSVSDTNFRGTGDLVSITYEKSGSETDAQGYNFTYRHPWLDRHETAIRFQLYNRTSAYNDYNSDGDFLEEYMRKYSGGEITLSRPVSEYSTNYITLRNRKDKYVRHVSSGDAGDRSTEEYSDWRHSNFGLTRSIILEHITDTRDNIYMPTEGNKVDLSLEVGAFGGDFDFQKISIDHQNYQKAGDHDQVWAIRGMAGYAHGELTEFNMFRVGGQNSLRGYRDDQFRGSRMLLGSIEYRFPLAKKIQGSIFTDFGYAWDGGFKFKDMKASIGVGVALNTPMGPLRLDYGRGSQGGRFHFSVGTSF
ncbi:MAG: BamA/TamA family outer membrane protein [Selenomonadaceae bacterium]|nr:BamA/TamA family outer membrane protein [Selenomonadaceae bacterium]